MYGIYWRVCSETPGNGEGGRILQREVDCGSVVTEATSSPLGSSLLLPKLKPLNRMENTAREAGLEMTHQVRCQSRNFQKASENTGPESQGRVRTEVLN